MDERQRTAVRAALFVDLLATLPTAQDAWFRGPEHVAERQAKADEIKAQMDRLGPPAPA